MNRRRRVYVKLNLLSLFFIAVSLTSITLAWFAYSGIASVDTEIDVKAWYIEFQKDNTAVTNNIVISLSDIYPGMDTVSEKVDINNMGDSDAEISYKIESARILDEDLVGLDHLALEDKLSHDYPFHLNINLSNNYATAKDGHSQIEVSVSWPLDFDNDEVDSEWGNKAFAFQKSENDKFNLDPNYQIRSSLKVVISVKAEQYMNSNESPDLNYGLGQVVLYDVVNNKVCNELGGTCIKTYVIDNNNKVGDKSVTLLPDLFDSYKSGTYDEYTSLFNSLASEWKVNLRPLKVEDVLKIVSNDVTNSVLVRDGLSNDIIGHLKYNDRINTELNKAISYNGYYTFMNSRFNYLMTSRCYWLNNEYNDGAFALVKVDNDTSKIYKEDRSNSCNIVPVITVSKGNLKFDV